jgi:hypothetical protein
VSLDMKEENNRAETKERDNRASCCVKEDGLSLDAGRLRGRVANIAAKQD